MKTFSTKKYFLQIKNVGNTYKVPGSKNYELTRYFYQITYYLLWYQVTKSTSDITNGTFPYLDKWTRKDKILLNTIMN